MIGDLSCQHFVVSQAAILPGASSQRKRLTICYEHCGMQKH